MERTVSVAGSAADSVVDRLITAEHDDLADILAMVTTLEQLRRRGLTPDQMARHMDIEWVECPGGGAWTAATVTTILEVVDTFHLDGSGTEAEPSTGSTSLDPRTSREVIVDSPAIERAKQTNRAPAFLDEHPPDNHPRIPTSDEGRRGRRRRTRKKRRS
ncbi:MAG: hypothetical protein GY724_09020 [Actinomycetia bacterium]|nr:hypothetical protein [Actinomycetes bacterium]MCP4222499.1 hypothetical protein [Actinomycetes bacterium]MCP5030501.1 hypothetical protein [Actinomycetes bacterium]